MSAELLDTNIIVYAYDASEKEKHGTCKKLVEACWSSKKSYAVSLQNLSEFYVVITEKVERPLAAEAAGEIISDIINFQGWKKLAIESSTILSAINIAKEYDLRYWDALLAATMRTNQVFTIYTEDEEFNKIPWLKVINPFGGKG